MKNLLIDTNIYTYALKGAPQVVSVLQQAHEIGISAVSIGELLSGFKGGKKEQENRRELAEFLDSPRVRVYGIDEETSEFYAEVLHNLEKKERSIPTNDVWIAALAFQHGQPLFSRDKHFEEVPGLMMVSC